MDNKNPQAPSEATESDQGETESQPNQYVTPDMLNRAFTERFKSFERKMDRFLQASQSQPQPQSEAKSEQEHKSKNPEMESLRMELNKIKQERDEERSKSKSVKLQQALADSLAEVGVDNRVKMNHAIGYLTSVAKAVSYDDEDNIVFSIDGEQLPLKDGLKQWLKTEDAKLYVAPKMASGSGDKKSNSTLSRTNQPPSVDETISSLLKRK